MTTTCPHNNDQLVAAVHHLTEVEIPARQAKCRNAKARADREFNQEALAHLEAIHAYLAPQIEIQNHEVKS